MRKTGLPNREKAQDIRSVKLLFSFLLPYKKYIILSLIAMLFSTAAVLAIPQGIKTLVDEAMSTKSTALLNKAVLLMVGLVVVLGLSIYARNIYSRMLGVLMVADIRNKVYRHILYLSPTFYDKRRTGEIISRLTADVAILRITWGMQIPYVVRGLLMLFAGLGLLFYTSVKLTLILLVVVPPVMVISLMLGKSMRKHSKNQQDKVADLSVQVEESISAVRTVQAFTQEEFEVARYARSVDESIDAAKLQIRSTALFFSVSVAIAFAGVIGVLWLGGSEVIADKMTAGTLLAYLMYVLFLGDALGSISQFYSSLQSAAGAAERLFDLLDARTDVRQPKEPKSLKEAQKGREIIFDKVSFAYPANEHEAILKDLNLHIKAGETLAIVGPSGAGKSTLFHLLLRFYDPIKGSIVLDGEKLTEVDLQAIRKSVAMVAQESTVFATSVMENIRYGKPDATDDEVIEAAKLAQVHAFVQEFENGYDTYLGEKGVRLSGGQKQRIAIARTILRNPDVLLLDEATSNLDAKSEQKIQQAIEEVAKERTTLVIAHRLATVKSADRIIVMNKGQIVDEGKHEDLLESSALYKSLAELQFLRTDH